MVYKCTISASNNKGPQLPNSKRVNSWKLLTRLHLVS